MLGSTEERPLPHVRLRLSSKLVPSKYLKNINFKGAKLLVYAMDLQFSVQINALYII